MRFSLLCGVALFGTLAACNRASYVVLPTTPTYHATVTRPASPATPALALEELATASSTPTPVRASETQHLTLGHSAPVRHKVKLRSSITAPLGQMALRPLQARRGNTLTTQHSSSTNSTAVAALGLIMAVIGGLILFLGVVYGAGAGLILVSSLLFIGGIFLAFRHLRNG